MTLPTFVPDARTVVLVLIFAAGFTLMQALWGLLRHGRTRKAVNRRLALAEGGATLGELVTELRKQRGLAEDGGRRFRWEFLSDLIIRSGVVFEPKRMALLIGGCGLFGAIVVLVFTHTPLIALAAGLFMAGFGPITWLKMKAAKRAKKLGAQLPDALEVIVRSLEAGHPVPTAMSLVGRELPDPIGSEFGMASDEIAYGATLEQAVAHISDRCRHPDVDLFAATIRLQERSGGNLTGLLKMNAKTVRDRHKMRLKIQAASSEGRASAMILTSAPFCAMGFIMISSPHFYGDVINEPAVKIGLVIIASWLVIGNLVMRRMIDMRI